MDIFTYVFASWIIETDSGTSQCSVESSSDAEPAVSDHGNRDCPIYPFKSTEAERLRKSIPVA